MIGQQEIPEPSAVEIISLDDQLADRGVPVFERPFQAAKLWGEKFGNPLAALESEGSFRQRYRELHPPVPFGSESFLTLCVSARAVSYPIRPPMAYGQVGIKPLDHTTISKFEIARLWHDHREAFWELHWQGFDAIDLFMSLVNFHSKEVLSKNLVQTAVNQLSASARQIIACEIDASLPQGIAMAAELAGKSVFLRLGGAESDLRSIGHDLTKWLSVSHH
jgi:hypothetical protein